MASINLYIDTTDNALLLGTQQAQNVDPLTLPFFYGDTVTINLWLFQRIAAAVNPANNFPFSVINNAGLAIELYIDDGTIAGTENPLAACLAWVPDPTNSYVTGTLSLNTAGLAALLGTGTVKQAWISIGYVQGGLTTTVFKAQISIGVGVLDGVQAPPPTLTPLSAEVAKLTFFPLQPVQGQPLYLMSKNGKILMLSAVDQPDGSASFEATPID